ncbi:Bacteriocin UviA [compost metagenome]
MGLSYSFKESVERAFSKYVKACLQHAQKDYSEKLRRDSTHLIPLDAVTFEININLLIRPFDMQHTRNLTDLSQFIELLNLSKKEQQIIYHKYYRDKTDREIAQLLGISRQAVSKIKSNALAKLKSIMEK